MLLELAWGYQPSFEAFHCIWPPQETISNRCSTVYADCSRISCLALAFISLRPIPYYPRGWKWEKGQTRRITGNDLCCDGGADADEDVASLIKTQSSLIKTGLATRGRGRSLLVRSFGIGGIRPLFTQKWAHVVYAPVGSSLFHWSLAKVVTLIWASVFLRVANIKLLLPTYVFGQVTETLIRTYTSGHWVAYFR